MQLRMEWAFLYLSVLSVGVDQRALVILKCQFVIQIIYGDHFLTSPGLKLNYNPMK